MRFLLFFATLFLAFTAAAQTAELAWMGYGDIFKFRPVADTAAMRKAGVRAVKAYLYGRDTLHADLRDTAKNDCELMLFNRKGQPVVTYRNMFDTYEKSTVEWNAAGQHTSYFYYTREEDSKSWKLKLRTTWKYDTAGNRTHTLYEARKKNAYVLQSETRNTYDAQGRYTLSVATLLEYRPFPLIDTTLFSYPDSNTICRARWDCMLTGDSIIRSDTSFYIEHYENGSLLWELDITRYGDTTKTTYSYDANGKLRTVETSSRNGMCWSGNDARPAIVHYSLLYDERGLPVRLKTTCGDVQEEMYFSYLYY